MVLVVLMWFLAQPPDDDEQALRTVDPSADVAAFQADVPSVPAPAGLPEQWRSTSSTLTADGLRIGWVTPDGEYAEYAASTLPADEALPDLDGQPRPSGASRWSSTARSGSSTGRPTARCRSSGRTARRSWWWAPSARRRTSPSSRCSSRSLRA